MPLAISRLRVLLLTMLVCLMAMTSSACGRLASNEPANQVNNRSADAAKNTDRSSDRSSDRLSDQASHQDNAGKPIILLLLYDYNNEYFRKIDEGFRSGMDSQLKKNYSLAIRYGSAQSDVSAQRRELDRYYSDYVLGRSDPQLKAVVIAPIGSNDEITAQIKQLKDSHVPVIIVDLRINQDALARAHTDIDAFIGSKNRAGGALAADEMAGLLPKGGTILVLNGVVGMEATIERRLGFITRLSQLEKQNSVHYKLIERTANFARSEAQSVVDGLLSMGQQLDGIFAANDEMALGASEALRQKSAGHKTFVVGFDAIHEAVTAIKDGRLAATIAQDPVGIGQRAAKTVERLLNHQTVPKEQMLLPTVVR